MAWKTIYEGTSWEEGAQAVANSLKKADRDREEYFRNQGVRLSSSIPSLHTGLKKNLKTTSKQL